MSTVYYGAYDDDDQPIGLFRKLQDDEQETLTLERLTADGAWLDDPSLIDELREPEVRIIDADEAATVRDLLAAGATPDTQPPPEDANV